MVTIKIILLIVVSSLVLLFYTVCDTLLASRDLPFVPEINRRRNNTSTENQILVQNVSAELKRLSDIVQNQLMDLQSRTDCDAPNIICQHHSNCGFGCQIHHRVICLALSFAMNRSLLVGKNQWSYKKKLDEKFYKVDNNCSINSDTVALRGATNPPHLILLRTRRIVKYVLKDGIPLSMEIFGELPKIHSNPFIWFMGQLEHFSMRLLPSEAKLFMESKEKIGFESPIVGVHVRRTDKLRENPGSFHSIEEYMIEAEKYFKENHSRSTERRVFVASEDSEILEEIRTRFSEWKILGFELQRSSDNMTERVDLLDDIVRDVLLLSQCDFVVCGFTSNICRLVYELQQFKFFDASESTKSMDHEYYFDKIKPNIVYV